MADCWSTARARCSPRAARAAWATCTSSRASTARRASSRRGEPGEARKLALELRVLADVGLLGLPNAGKSTFIRAVSTARPQDRRLSVHHAASRTWAWCASAPSRASSSPTFPGLIEGAAEGAGLGHQFLRHLQRTRLLLHLVDIAPLDEGADPVAKAQGDRRRAEEVRRGAVRQAALAGVQQDRPGPERRARRSASRIVQRLRWKGPVFTISALTARAARSWSRAVYEHVRRAAGRAERRSALRPDDRRRRPNERASCSGARRWSSRSAPGSSPTRAAAWTPHAIGAGRRRSRALRAQGREVVLVSSGAIAEGMQRLGWTRAPERHARAAGRRGRRPDGPGADVRDVLSRARPAHRAGAAHARRPGRPAALPERALDAAHAARPAA